MSYSKNVPVVVEWSDEQKQAHLRDINEGSSVWTEVCTCTDEAGAVAVREVLMDRAAVRAELDRSKKAISDMVLKGLREYVELTGQIDELTMDRDDLLEALKTLVGCIEGYPDMMAEPAVAECMKVALEALEVVGEEVSDE